MSEEINDSMSFEEMLNASEEKRVHASSIVKGIVTSISANEIQVDIGAKQTGFVKLSRLTDDSSAKVEDLVKVGDELDLIVEKVMDQDGVIQLSRKARIAQRAWRRSPKAAESGEVVEGDVTEFNKGGVVGQRQRASRCSCPVLRPRCAATRIIPPWSASTCSWS